MNQWWLPADHPVVKLRHSPNSSGNIAHQLPPACDGHSRQDHHRDYTARQRTALRRLATDQKEENSAK